MEHTSGTLAPLTVALALAVGMVAQSLARHVRLPGIVLLLACGVALGPDFAGWVRPGALGEGLQVLVGFSVSVILFEGGLGLGLRRLRRQARVIQLLITVGALITALGGSFAARLLLGWDWWLAAPFGALVVVTGPTVITPLLRRIKVESGVETVLEAEGVLVDSIGAVLAVITLEVVLSNPTGSNIAEGGMNVLTHLGFGLGMGLVGGLIIGLLLRYRKVVPDGLENVFTLTFVLVLFQSSNAWMAESGIMAVTAAGVVVGNMRTRVHRELAEFKEQLTVMLIGMLFVLLAADVRISDVRDLGLPGVLTLAALMLVVRPLSVFVSTYGSELNLRQKLFLSWLAPRGVVAAAVASLFAQSLDAAGIPGGASLRAMVFAVIAGTVLIQGLSGGPVARLLGLKRVSGRGYAILGANALARCVGRLLREAGHELVFIDNDPFVCKLAEEEGFRVVYGNVLEERTLLRAGMEDRFACLAASTNAELNLIFARTAVEEFRVRNVDLALRRDSQSVKPGLLQSMHAGVLFAEPRDLDLWAVRVRRGLTTVEPWRLEGKSEQPGQTPEEQEHSSWATLILPLVQTRGKQTQAVTSRRPFRRGDVVHFALLTERIEQARERLSREGWERVEDAGAQRGD